MKATDPIPCQCNCHNPMIMAVHFDTCCCPHEYRYNCPECDPYKEFDEALHLSQLPAWIIDPDHNPGPICHNCFDGHHEACLDINMVHEKYGQVACDCRNRKCERR